MTNNTQIQENKVGRPTVMTADVVEKLVAIIRQGLSIQTACEYARIDRGTFYNHLQNDPEFFNKINDAKNFLKLIAAKRVVETIQDAGHRDSAKVAMWALERKEPEEFGAKPEVIVNNNIEYKPPSWFKPPVVQEGEVVNGQPTDTNK